MNLDELFIKEENPQLERKTLTFLRWIAIVGQIVTILIVYFLFKFSLPIIPCLLIIILGTISNIYLQFSIKKNELSNLESTIFLLYDIFQLSLLIFLTGGIKNPFLIFIVIPAIVGSTLLSLKSTFFLSFSSIFFIVLLTFSPLPLPHPGNLHFHVPGYYLYSIPLATIIILVFLTYFGARFGLERKKRVEALNKLELIMAKEHELESIGYQAAAAAHSLGTPLSTITVIAGELKKEILKDPKHAKDIDLLISQAKRCKEILKKISLNQMGNDKFISNVSLKILMNEISDSFTEISDKRININLNEYKNDISIKRSPEITYGVRNFFGNAVKYSKSEININLITDKKKIKIIITDNGPGFPKDILENIGQPYLVSSSAVLNEKRGLGLGTFIGKTLLERSKASLKFSNLKKGGAKVDISWDISDITI